MGAVVLYGIRRWLLQVRREIESRYRRTESWAAIYSVITPRLPLPAVRSWMASPELLREAVYYIYERRPKVILELGSGLSTVVCGYAAEAIGARVVSLDHEPEFAAQTRELLKRHGLDNVATVVDAPLSDTPVGDERIPWYSLQGLDELSLPAIGLVIVDGPPGANHPLSRYPAVPRLWDRLTDDAVIILDDARRPEEQEILRRWTAEHPGLKSQYHATEKGTGVLTRTPA